MKLIWLSAALLLALCAGLAHAEGNHDLHGIVELLVYGLIALIVMLGQGVYVLCRPRARWGLKLLWLAGLAVIDMFVVRFMLALLDDNVMALDNVIPYLLVVVPGFVFVYLVQKHWNRPQETGPI